MEDLGQKLDALQSIILSLEARVSKIDAQVEMMDDDVGEADTPVVWGGDGTEGDYTSYFRVIDATTTPGTLLLGVTDGGYDGTPTYCGVCKVNGVSVSVLVPSNESLTEAGTYCTWLHSWIKYDAGEDEYLKYCEIIFGVKDSYDKPDNPNDGIGWGSELLGRAIVVDNAGVLSMTIIQDYKKGGEHTEIIRGDCNGGAVEEA